MFPTIDQAKTIRDMLVDTLREKGVTSICDTTVLDISKKDRWMVKTATNEYSSQYCIVATGGKTYPALGSDGSGYTLIQKLGHTIIPPVPSAVPLVSKNVLSHLLQGEKMTMQVTAYIDDKETMVAVGEVMFTQYGFSGPAILDVSRDISIQINRQKKQDAKIVLSFLPSVSKEEAARRIKKRLEQHPTFLVSHCLYGLFTQKVAHAICEVSAIPKDRIAHDVTSDEMERIIGTITGYTAHISATRGWNESEFTTGGVDTKEVQEKTLESKKIKSLFFAGELLDVDGPVGGFNLSWAWASGWVAGKITPSL